MQLTAELWWRAQFRISLVRYRATWSQIWGYVRRVCSRRPCFAREVRINLLRSFHRHNEIPTRPVSLSTRGPEENSVLNASRLGSHRIASYRGDHIRPKWGIITTFKKMMVVFRELWSSAAAKARPSPPADLQRSRRDHSDDDDGR